MIVAKMTMGRMTKEWWDDSKIYSRQLDDSSLIEKWAQLWPKSRGAAITVVSYSLVSMTSFHHDV